jgi:hypothetical protein
MNKEVIMRHIPLLAPSTPDTILEFSHFDYDASAGEWKKDKKLHRCEAVQFLRYSIPQARL